MAESSKQSTDSGNHVCPICQEKLVIPRSIPSCKHTFCEKCLFTFVFNLKEKGELGLTFECPVCRCPCKMNESGKVTMEWIQTFPVFSTKSISDELDPSESESRSEKEEVNHKCGSCLEEGSPATGTKYCLDCIGYLCDDCVASHLKCKALINHKILEQNDFDYSMDAFENVQKLKRCRKHTAYDVELYCKYHEELMCLMCSATSHKECKNIIALSEGSTLSDKKSTSLYVRINGAEKYLDSLKKISEENCETVKAKVKSYRNELQQRKDDIIKRLNEIVDNEQALTKRLIIDVEDHTFLNKQRVENLKELCKKKKAYLHSVVKNGRPREIFVCIENIVADVEDLEKQIYQIESGFKSAEIYLKTTGVLKSVSEKLVEDHLPMPSVKYHRPKSLQTLETSTGSYKVEKVATHQVQMTDYYYYRSVFSSIAVTRNGILVLCDTVGGSSGSGITVYDPQTKKNQMINLDRSYCATPVNENSIAVTMPSKKSISILSLGLIETKHIPFNYTPQGIVALNDGTMAISWDGPPAFSISDLSGPKILSTVYFTEDNTGRKFKTFDYLAINEKRQYVIQPCTEDNALYCFTFKKQPVFKYTNNLKEPNGVAVDPTSGIVFVCDSGSNSIHQVSVSGNPISIIRHSTLEKPLSVCFDGEKKCLWVSQYTLSNQFSCYTLTKA